MKLSICMMVKNEEKNLERCLKSLTPILNQSEVELIIVDTGSEDNTVKIAKKYTEKVFFHEWNNNFSDMRNKTISYARGKWIFIIDADEELVNTDKLNELIHSSEINQYKTIVLQVKSFNDLENKDTAAINPSPRIFKNDGEFKYLGAVHNQPVYKKPIKVTNIMLNHYGYILEDKELMEKKFHRTKLILEKELSKDPNNVYYQFQLGVTYDMHGDAKDAYREFKKAYNMLSNKTVKDKKERIYIYSSFARSASLNKMYQEVIKICKEGINLRKDFIDLYYILAVTERQVGNYENSISQLETYLNLINNFEELEISRDLSVSFYNMDESSIQSAYFNLFLNYMDIGGYSKAKDYVSYLKDITKKIYCYTNLMSYIDLEEELLNFYNEIDSNYKREFSEIVENKIETLDNEKQNKIRTIFSKVNDIYSTYNKIILEEGIYNNKILNEENLNFIYKINLNKSSDYLGRLIYIVMKNKGDVYEMLHKVSENNIERLIKYCYLKFPDMVKITEEYMYNNEFFNENNIDDLRINKILLKNFLLHNKNKEDCKDVFYFYINTGINYIKSIYKTEIIEREMIYNIKEEDAFLILVNKAQEIRKTDIKQYVQYLRKALFIYNDFKDYIEIFNKEIESELDKKEVDSSMEIMKKQVKDNIQLLINSGSLEEAENLLSEYFKMVQDDVEAYSIKAIIAIMENRINEAEEILKHGLSIDNSNFDLNYNLAYVYEQQGEYKEAIKYYIHAYNKTLNEELRNQIKILVENILQNTEENQEFDMVLKQYTNKKKCLIICSFYSVFTKEFIENMKKHNDVIFDVLTMDSSYIKEKEKGNVNQVYIYKNIDELNEIFNNLNKYNVMHIHFLNPFYSVLTDKIKEKCDELIISIWGSDYYRVSERDRLIQKNILNLADSITFANESTIKDFEKYYKFKYSSKLQLCRFGLTPLEYINLFSNEDYIKIKSDLGIPTDAVVVTCGYNASPAQNHLDIINSIMEVKDRLPDNLFLVFPMTYGDDSHRRNVKIQIKKSGIKYKVFEQFLSNEDVAKLRIISNVMIQLQTTDQLSGSMQEYLYSNNIVITGSWLPYKILKDKGCFFLEVAQIEDVGEKLLFAINNSKEISDKCNLNKRIIGGLSLWENTINDWIEAYKKR